MSQAAAIVAEIAGESPAEPKTPRLLSVPASQIAQSPNWLQSEVKWSKREILRRIYGVLVKEPDLSGLLLHAKFIHFVQITTELLVYYASV